MKKNILMHFLLAVALTGSLAGCKKWLDLKPRDGIVGDEFWQTKEQVDAAVTGIYASIEASTVTNGRALTDYMFVWGEARADMVTTGNRTSPDEQDMININMTANNAFSDWAGFYRTINYCNVVIDLAPGVLQKDNTFTQQHLDRSVGQALAIRALMYFYLVRTFRDVPLKLDATVSDEKIAPIPKTGADTILNQIVTDLKQAETKLPATYGRTAAFDKGRVTRYGANAILADVYLWMDRYADAAAECDKIISSNAFQLVPGNQFFNSIFLTGASEETIFELQYDEQLLNPFYNMHTPSQKRWSGALNLAESVFGLDLVNATPLLDYRGENAAYREGDFSIWKYVGADNNGDNFRTVDQSFAPWIFYRYADALLIKAEAVNQLNRPLEASRLVKAIRQRAGALDFMPMDSTDKSAMTNFIVAERQREFAFEGKRWFDLLRNAKRNNYEQLTFLTNSAAISIVPSLQQAAFNKLKDPNSHYMPIYFYELSSNPLLVQNPFYR
ncbi:RagB/SusD family nutrient uptake outer membrane protein [Niabella sp. CJ426]|uniref:RagB/SusD family nutrient uptake outer membrane protein n=1 Tax=Niabella sp. CJ426 TaxID=3393740 RepID=UPI003D071A9A